MTDLSSNQIDSLREILGMIEHAYRHHQVLAYTKMIHVYFETLGTYEHEGIDTEEFFHEGMKRLENLVEGDGE